MSEPTLDPELERALKLHRSLNHLYEKEVAEAVRAAETRLLARVREMIVSAKQSAETVSAKGQYPAERERWGTVARSFDYILATINAEYPQADASAIPARPEETR